MNVNVKENEVKFKYLFDLQKSGKTNMLGAGAYLRKKFGLDQKTANDILLQWMTDYDDIAKELGVTV